MHNSFFSPGAFLFLVSFASFASGAAMLNASTVPTGIIHFQYLSNSALSDIPAGFTVKIQQPRGSYLPAKLCFEGAITLIARDLALEDPRGKISGLSWAFDNVVIGVSTTMATSADTIERRFVMWGLLVALTKMADEVGFGSAVFLLKWQGGIVGSLALYDKGSLGLNASSDSLNMTTEVITQLPFVGGGANGSILSTSTSLGEQIELQFHLLEDPRVLNQHNVFLNVIGVLIHAADHGADESIRERYLCSITDHGIVVYVSGPRSSQPPSMAPFLTYRIVVTAMAAVPQALARPGFQYAFEIEISIDRLSFAQIVFRPTESGMVLTVADSPQEASFNGSAT